MDKVTANGTEWSEGTVVLTDGKTLTGQLRLNTKTGLLAFEQGEISRSFNARNVAGFSYFDAVENKVRNFLSVTYRSVKPKDDGAFAVMKKDRQKTTSEMGVPHFYEILVDCRTFALLSTFGQISVTQSNGTPLAADPSTGNTLFSGSPSTSYAQTETLVIFDEQEIVTPILDITHTETDRLIFDGSKTKNKLDKSVLENYTKPYYEQLEAYAKERKLSFKKRDDLIKILEYYKTLSTD